MYTALTQQHKVGPKNLNQLLISQQWDLRSLGPEHAHTHTHTGVDRQDPVAGKVGK